MNRLAAVVLREWQGRWKVHTLVYVASRDGKLRPLPGVRPLAVFPSLSPHGDAGTYAWKGRDFVRIDPASGTTLLVQRDAQPARLLRLY